MEAEALFLETLAELERYAAAGDDYSMLRASALLRQLLIDQHPLVHLVNRKHKLPLRFTVRGRLYREVVLADNPDFYSALGGIHTSGPFPHQAEQLSLDKFLATQVVKVGKQLLSIGDLISISANVLGGVHKGEPKESKERALTDFRRHLTFPGGRSLNAEQMKPSFSLCSILSSPCGTQFPFNKRGTSSPPAASGSPFESQKVPDASSWFYRRRSPLLPTP